MIRAFVSEVGERAKPEMMSGVNDTPAGSCLEAELNLVRAILGTRGDVGIGGPAGLCGPPGPDGERGLAGQLGEKGAVGAKGEFYPSDCSHQDLLSPESGLAESASISPRSSG